MTPATTGLTYTSFVTFQTTATVSVRYHVMRLIAAAAVALTAYFGSGGDGAKADAVQLTSISVAGQDNA